MHSAGHALVGAAAAVLPDAALFLYGWRRQWLPTSHPLVRLNGRLHGPVGLLLCLALGYGSHLLVDHYSTHRQGPGS